MLPGESAGQAGKGLLFLGVAAVGLFPGQGLPGAESQGTGLREMVCGQQARNDRWSPGQSLLERSLKTISQRKGPV